MSRDIVHTLMIGVVADVDGPGRDHAVVLEGRSKSEVARDYGVSRRWVQRLVARYHAEGEAAFEPRSRRRTATHVGSARTSKTRSSRCASN